MITTCLNILFHYFINPVVMTDFRLIAFDIAFVWNNTGIISSFAYQLGFYLIISLFIHTLVLYQNMWIGWVANVVLITIISVFTPIASLMAVLVAFFNITVINSSEVM
ncbi:hypothetical protein RI065_10840 [Mycoplasmatota bacterium zrk1]